MGFLISERGPGSHLSHWEMVPLHTWLVLDCTVLTYVTLVCCGHHGGTVVIGMPSLHDTPKLLNLLHLQLGSSEQLLVAYCTHCLQASLHLSADNMRLFLAAALNHLCIIKLWPVFKSVLCWFSSLPLVHFGACYRNNWLIHNFALNLRSRISQAFDNCLLHDNSPLLIILRNSVSAIE